MVSIIIPIYRVEKYLSKCIESLLCQTLTDIELILVDDGSPDGCGKICDHYAAQDSRIRVLHQENKGLVSARKAGFLLSQGDYLGYVDGDDWVEPETFEVLLDALVKTKADVVAAGYSEDIGDVSIATCLNGLNCGVYETKDDTYFRENMILSKTAGSFGVNTYLWNKLFRRDALAPHQMAVDSSITLGEDAACLYPLLIDCRLCIIDSTLYHYRQRTDSMIKGWKPSKADKERIALLRQYLLDSVRLCEDKEALGNQVELYIDNLAMVRGIDLSSRADSIDASLMFPPAKKGDKIVLCGSGTFGQHLMRKLEQSGLECILWIDPRYYHYRKLGVEVESLETVLGASFDYILLAFSNALVSLHVKQRLINLGVDEGFILLASFVREEI